MQRLKIEKGEDFKAAMAAVQSSIELLDLWDWQNWLEQEGFFRTAGSMINPEVFEAMKKDPQWEMKVAVIRAAADYMMKIREIRAPLEKPDEG